MKFYMRSSRPGTLFLKQQFKKYYSKVDLLMEQSYKWLYSQITVKRGETKILKLS